MNRKNLIKEKIGGKTYAEIAKEYGVSRQRIQQSIRPARKIRLEVYAKYNNECCFCGKFVGTSGHIHHKGNKSKYNNIHNLLLLCVSCHMKLHHKKKIEPKKKKINKIFLKCYFIKRKKMPVLMCCLSLKSKYFT